MPLVDTVYVVELPLTTVLLGNTISLTPAPPVSATLTVKVTLFLVQEVGLPVILIVGLVLSIFVTDIVVDTSLPTLSLPLNIYLPLLDTVYVVEAPLTTVPFGRTISLKPLWVSAPFMVKVTFPLVQEVGFPVTLIVGIVLSILVTDTVWEVSFPALSLTLKI